MPLVIVTRQVADPALVQELRRLADAGDKIAEAIAKLSGDGDDAELEQRFGAIHQALAEAVARGTPGGPPA